MEDKKGLILGKKYNVTWQQTMLRINNPKETVEFYENNFGMINIHTYHFNEYNFSLYFMIAPPYDEDERKKLPKPIFLRPSSESSDYNFDLLKNSFQSNENYENFKSSWEPVLELTHNHGTENDENFAYHNGNTEPRGFGHIGFLVDDLQSYCKELESLNIPFKKKINEGLMNNIAFIYDPDNYLIEHLVNGIYRCTSFIPKRLIYIAFLFYISIVPGIAQ